MSGDPPLAEELADFVAGFDIMTARDSEMLLERARLHVLDTVGLALIGWRAEDRIGDALVSGAASADGPSTVIGSRRSTDAAFAALVNATLATVWTFDDADPVTTMHCEAFAACSALSLAEERRSSGRALAEAFIVGAEVALRLASAVHGDRGLYDTGFHGTPVFGTIGAAAGAAKVLGLGPEQTADALALAASFASGTSAGWTQASGRNKTLHPGWAAHSGVIAARLAEAGYDCSHETLDGERGLLQAHTWRSGWSRGPVTAGLGTDWRLRNLYVKLHPSGSSTQAALDCALQLYHQHGVRGEDVRSGVITIPAHLSTVLADIGDSLYRPTTGSASIGSFPVVAARVLLEGSYTIAHRTDEAIREPRLLELADTLLVRAGGGEEHLELPPGDRPTTVEVVTSSGTHRVESAGDDHELRREAIVGKFMANASLALGSTRAELIRDSCLDLERLADVTVLTASLTASE